MKKSLVFIVALLALFACGKSKKSQSPHQALINELKNYILAHHQSPEDYVISKFRDHDVVFLGEMHRIKHDPELIQKLIPLLHESGVYALATEFARSEDQPLIDSLLSGDTYDERLARLITFQGGVYWAYREYVDIFKAAWFLNRSLPKDARGFRILGVNCSCDWSVIKTPEDWDIFQIPTGKATDSLRALVWGSCTEKDWADVILDRVEQGEKVLVYSGMHHAFSGYLQPVVNKDYEFVGYREDRMGRHVYEAIGKRAVTVFLHGVWLPPRVFDDLPVRPIDGIIDEVMDSLGERFAPVGFDVVGTPFGRLAPENTYYRITYGSFTLADYCDGYIYQKPFRQYEPVTFIDSFVTEENLDYARQNTPNPSYRDFTLESYNAIGKEDLTKKRRLWRGL